jgi:Zn-finger nucleic acid-binding protein
MQQGVGPYRSTGGAHEASPIDASCPYCGNECPPMVRICPHCDVRLDNVRCQRCFSLQAPGAFSCTRCGHALELEPLLDATDAPCPRCSVSGEARGANHALEVSPGEDKRVHECPRCGGMFVARDALADILCSAEIGGALAQVSSSAPPALDEIRYLPCPQCHAAMNRVNFGRVSGVIVDVCKTHGTWFDAGELTRVIAFAGAGGLEKTREREKDDKRGDDSRPPPPGMHAELVTAMKMEAHAGTERIEAWRDFLRYLFTW